MRRLTAVVLGAALAAATWAEDGAPAPPKPDLAALLAAVRDADGERRDAAVAAVLGLDPKADDVASALAAGLPRPAARPGWQVLAARDEVGVDRPYHLYVPKSAAESATPAPLLVDLHGGVGRPVFIPEEQFAQYRDTWTELADRHGFVVAMPLGRADCTWWSAAGAGHVRATVRDARRRVAVDGDRIVATGFSDGGSGCWYLTMASPDPFAAFLPMNGHPVVASRASGAQLYLENAVATPLFAAMTQDDGLYPAASVLPHVQALFDLKAQVHLVSYPTGGHTPSYFDDQKEAFVKFALSARRDVSPDAVEWRTADAALGRFRWIEVDELGPGDGDAAAVPDVQVTTRPGRVTLGFRIDQKHAGTGVAVEGVMDDTPAKRAGLLAGDVIVGIDGKPTGDAAALRRALDAKAAGDEVKVSVRRGDADVALTARIDPFVPAPSYERAKPASRVVARRTGNVVDVTTRGVRRFRVLVHPGDFDLSQEVEVRVNGTTRSRSKVEPDLKTMLRRYAADADDRRVVLAEIAVTIPAAAGAR
jgi:membrane-associated protease RseP (regulator of RpoE activity)